MEIKLLLPSDIEAIMAFEKKSLPDHLSPIEIEMKSWEKPWRKESLEHYTGLGWSFIAIDQSKVVGYVLAQPLLFFNNWTQSLWIESLSYTNNEIGLELMDVIIKWSKTKHLQKVVVNSKSEKLIKIQEQIPGFLQNTYQHLSTTKMSED